MEIDVQKHIDALPEKLIDAITETPIETILKETVNQFHIPLDKGSILERKSKLFAYGLISPQEFDTFISRFDGVPPESRAHLKSVLNEELFDVIRKKYQTYQEEDIYEDELDDFGDIPISQLNPADYGLTLEDLEDETDEKEEEAPKMITERMQKVTNTQSQYIHTIPTVDPYREPVE